MSKRPAILVAVSDNETARELTSVLAARNWEVVQARDAVSATAAVIRVRPEAVVLHGQLPGGGGIVTLRRLRASVHTTMTPVLAIAGRREGDADALRMHGADLCLTPPVSSTVIADWIAERVSGTNDVVFEAPRDILSDSDRVAALRRTTLLDSPPIASFDVLTRLASRVLKVPVALVSLVDENRQFFMSQVGLPAPWGAARETPLTHSFCQWVVSDHSALVVSDARSHDVLSRNRALSDLGVVAYAGIPLAGTTGEPIGSFCAIDSVPRNWPEADVVLLRALATVTEACIAAEESAAAGWPNTEHTEETAAPARSLVLRTLGEGIATATRIINGSDPRIGGTERQELLTVTEWIAKQVVRIASL